MTNELTVAEAFRIMAGRARAAAKAIRAASMLNGQEARVVELDAEFAEQMAREAERVG